MAKQTDTKTSFENATEQFANALEAKGVFGKGVAKQFASYIRNNTQTENFLNILVEKLLADRDGKQIDASAALAKLINVHFKAVADQFQYKMHVKDGAELNAIMDEALGFSKKKFTEMVMQSAGSQGAGFNPTYFTL